MHATAVAIAGRGLLIRGPSGSGKSALALALMAAATPARPALLVGDDRVLLRLEADAIVVRPHPRIAGFIERRGLGLLSVPWCGRAPLAGCVGIGDAAAFTGAAEDRLRTLPLLTLHALSAGTAGEAARRVLEWWGTHVVAADGTQVA